MTTGPAPAHPAPAATAGVLTAAGPGGAWAWVARNVEPVPGSASGDGTDRERRTEAALADAGWLAGQWDRAAGTKLELRYLHTPGEGVRCALLGRAYASTVDAATSAALRLGERLGMLPAHVRAAPVGSAAEIQQLLNPFPANLSGLVEVRKQIRPGRPTRPDAGVEYYLAVPRLAAGAASWEPLWQTVADLAQPFMLTVGLEPYTPPAQFVGMLGDLAARYGRLAIPGQTAQSPLRQRTSALAADPFAAYAARLYDDAWRHYQSAVFRTRITLASPAPLPPALVTQVAATICAPRDDGEITHVTVVPAPDELETAWHNVTTLDHARWDRHYLGHLPIPVPSGLRLLAETVDAAEAVSGWRLPPAPPADGRRVFVSVTAQTLHVDRLENAHVAGDSFSNIGEGVVIVNRSTSTSINTTQTGGGDKQTERSGNPAAAGSGLRILLVCANPRGSQPLRTGEEDRTLRESIRISPDRDRIEVETLNAATIDDLRRALLRRQFDVVHFSGHGTQLGLVFEDASGRIFVPPSEALAQLLERRQVRVAVLNACYSLSVGALSAIGSEYTIASSGPISDPAAIEFTRGFYDALGAGLAVPDAFEEGMGAASLRSLTFDAILLRRGEEYVAPSVAGRPGHGERPAQTRRVLVGVALDVSACMQTRFDSVRDSLAALGSHLRDDPRRQHADSQEAFRLFSYGYGLRAGDGVADLASMWRAAATVDVDAQVADVVVAETNRLGDSTLSAASIARLFDRKSGEELDSRVLDRIIFGTTPMVKAAQMIRDRFARMESEPYDERTLLVISGGEPTDGDPREVFEQLRGSGINVISVYVTGQDVADPRVLVSLPGSSWSKQAELMWEIASPVDESSPITRYLLDQGWSIEADAKLCVQVNNPDVLKEFVRVVGSQFSSGERSLLPRGR